MTTPDRENTLAHTSAMATHALRVLGSAFRELPHGVPAELTADVVERDLVFVGLTACMTRRGQKPKRRSRGVTTLASAS